MSPEEYRKLKANRARIDEIMTGPPRSKINPVTGLDPSKGNIPEMAARSKRERIADALGHAPMSQYHYSRRMDVLDTKAEKTWDPGELKKIDDEKERLTLDYERSIGYERPVEKVPDSELNFVGPEPQKPIDEFQAAADKEQVYKGKLSSIDPSKLPDVKGSSLDTDKFMSQVSSDPPLGHEMTSNEFIRPSQYKENLLDHIDTISNRPDSFFLAEGISREDYLRSVMDTHSDIVSKYGGDLSGLNRELSKNSSRSAVTGPAQQFREALGKRADVAKAAKERKAAQATTEPFPGHHLGPYRDYQNVGDFDRELETIAQMRERIAQKTYDPNKGSVAIDSTQQAAWDRMANADRLADSISEKKLSAQADRVRSDKAEFLKLQAAAKEGAVYKPTPFEDIDF